MTKYRYRFKTIGASGGYEVVVVATSLGGAQREMRRVTENSVDFRLLEITPND